MSQPREIEPLIHRFLDGGCSEAELAELEARIKSDSAAAETFARMTRLHASLTSLHQQVEADRSFAERLHQGTGDAFARSENAGETRPGTETDRAAFRRHWSVVSRAAAVIAATVLIGMLVLREPETTIAAPLVTLHDVSGNVLVESVNDAKGPRQASAGMSIAAGTKITTSGSQSVATLSYQDSTEVLVAGDSTVQFGVGHTEKSERANDGSKRLTVGHGTVSITVEQQPAGHPLILHTPVARIEVLGTEFSLATSERVTDLHVAEGRVKLIRERDGKSLVVSEGKRAVARAESSDLLVKDARERMDVWEESFEDGLPTFCKVGEPVRSDLPGDSTGGVSDVSVEKDSESYAIDLNDWIHGLFRVHDDSHLHMIYRMEKPGWMNVFFLTRGDDPRKTGGSIHLFNRMPSPAAGEWHKPVIPLSVFHRKVDGKFTQTPPKDGELCFGLFWHWVNGQRDMTIDRVWVTRGGSGKVALRKLDEAELSSLRKKEKDD